MALTPDFLVLSGHRNIPTMLRYADADLETVKQERIDTRRRGRGRPSESNVQDKGISLGHPPVPGTSLSLERQRLPPSTTRPLDSCFSYLGRSRLQSVE